MANLVQASYVTNTDDLSKYIELLKENGIKIVATKIKPKSTMCSYIPRLNVNNCVSLTKQILGIKLPRTFTPWQLYNRLLQLNETKEI